MAKKELDTQAAHKHFAVECFNLAWDLIDKPRRSKSEEDELLQLSLASLWHWRQRQDCTPTNLSIGCWQVSRVFALLRQADNARRYAELSLEASQSEGVELYYQGYAYEALARAEMVAGNEEAKEQHLVQAHQIAVTVADAEEKKQLLKDLATIR